MPDDNQEATGIAGLAAGDHLCCIYETEDEHRAVVTPFVRIGIERGERVMYIVDAHDAGTILAYLAQAGFDPKPALARGQFVLATGGDTYLRNGIFDPDAMVDLLRSESDRAAADGYTALRVTGEMTWALRGNKGAERLMEYEAKLNRFFPGSNVLGVCQYDRRRFPARVVQEVLRTHPFVVYRGQVYRNFYYIPVEDFLGGKKPEVEVAHWLDSLQREHDATAARSNLETEQRRVLDALLTSEMRYRSLVNHMPDGVAVYEAVSDGEDFVFVDFNSTASRIDSVARETVVGRRVTEAFPGVKDFGLLDVFRRVWRTGTPEEHPVSAYRDGRIEGWRENFVYKLASGEIVAIYRDVTALKQAEEALRNRESVLQRIFDVLPVGLWFVDKDGKLLRGNPAGVKIWGAEPKVGLSGYGVFKARRLPSGKEVAPDDWALAHTIRDRVTIVDELLEIDAFDGKKKTILNYTAPVLDALGNVQGAIVVNQDITERKQAEEALRSAKAFLDSVINAIADPVFVKDDKRRFVLVNDALCAIVGRPREGLLGEDGDDMFPEEQVAVFRRMDAGVIDTGEENRNEELLSNLSSGEVRTIVTRKTRYIDPAGTRFLVGVIRDITERKQAEEALRFQKMLLESQNEASLDGILVVNANGKILWFNRQFLNMWGIPPDLAASGSDTAAIEGVLGQLVDPESFLAGLRRLYADREARSRDEIHLKDGRVFDRYSAPVVGEGHTYLGRVWLFRDVTEKTKLLASLAQSDRLASMGMLAAGVAHEINNPLTYVLSNLESLSEDLPKLADAVRRSDEELSARVHDVVEQAREALAGAERIKEISRGLGTFSRVEQTDLKPVDVRRAVEDAASIVSNEITYRARLVKDLRPVPAVLGSDGKLAQVFLNLLMNAAHAIAEGDVERNEIRVRTWAEGDQVFAEVSDTGTGIAPEHRSRIFQPFFTTKAVGAGSGLGLSICRNIVTGFGGEISFESEAGQGTRFLVRLPAMPDDPKAREEALSAEEPAALQPRGRILVVDDVAGVRKVLTRLLAGEHDVVSVSSGEEAQAILERDHGFDLLFFDLMMPRMSGMDLHEWLAQRNPVVADRVVFMTGGVFTPRAREYLAKAKNRQVAKPFDVRALKKLVRELVLAAKTKGS